MFNYRSKTFSNSINTDVIKVGGSIVFCDYLVILQIFRKFKYSDTFSLQCENSSKRTDVIDWVLKNNVNLLIELDQEAPINEFFSFIHRDSRLSGILIKYIDDQSNLLKSNVSTLFIHCKL